MSKSKKPLIDDDDKMDIPFTEWFRSYVDSKYPGWREEGTTGINQVELVKKLYKEIPNGYLPKVEIYKKSWITRNVNWQLTHPLDAVKIRGGRVKPLDSVTFAEYEEQREGLIQRHSDDFKRLALREVQFRLAKGLTVDIKTIVSDILGHLARAIGE